MRSASAIVAVSFLNFPPGVHATLPGVSFQVLLDGVSKYDSAKIDPSTPPKPISVDVPGGVVLELVTDSFGEASDDLAAWVDAKIVPTCAM
jgi:hypothetical protein